MILPTTPWNESTAIPGRSPLDDPCPSNQSSREPVSVAADYIGADRIATAERIVEIQQSVR